MSGTDALKAGKEARQATLAPDLDMNLKPRSTILSGLTLLASWFDGPFAKIYNRYFFGFDGIFGLAFPPFPSLYFSSLEVIFGCAVYVLILVQITETIT